MIKGQKINKNLNRNYIASNFNSNIKCHQSRQQRRITHINPTAAAATKTNVKNKKSREVSTHMLNCYAMQWL